MGGPDVSDYRIAIVCALPKELAAVLAILDEEHQSLTERDAQDENTYVLGRIHKHNVVVACLPVGNYGTESAAAVAKDLLRTFPSVRIGLMVGIGGGIPKLPKDDIRLGDVVISQPEGVHGGVVQYDLGKNVGGGKFERKGSLNQPPKPLLTALSLSQAKRAGVFTYLEEAYSQDATLLERGYGFPGAENDELRCAQCQIPFQSSSSWISQRCLSCRNGLILRDRRPHQEPVVHYGTIASGNLLIKDAALRDKLGQEFGAKCVEMEAAGLMNNFPCIVVRGICDYADSHKNDKWQEYASLTAAACAKELLSWLLPEKVEIGKFHLDESYQKCHQSFKTTTYETFKNVNPERIPDTCQWALKHSAFRQWYGSTKNDLLWISADPGCGKSVLARSLVDKDLQSGDNAKVCYFFFKDNEAQNNVFAALCSLLHQLFAFAPHLIRHAVPIWQQKGEGQNLETDQLWRIFWTATSDPQAPNVICVLDALDECQNTDRKMLIRALIGFHESVATISSSRAQAETAQTYLKFLATSRPYSDIEDDFELTRHLPSIRLRGEDENEQIHQEINMVIKIRVDELSSSLSLSQETRDRLEKQLLEMEHRTYLWLYLAIENIKETFRDSFRPDEESIEHLPTGVDDAYEKILSRACKKRQDLKLILQIIVGAKQPLTVGEMAIALGVANRERATTLKDSVLDKRHLEKQIRNWCGLFVYIADSTIFLIHQTAREFLIRTPDAAFIEGSWKYCLIPEDFEGVMASICIRVLLFRDVRKVLESLAEKLMNKMGSEASGILREIAEQADKTECFILYSAINWASHLSGSSLQTERTLQAKTLQLYNAKEAHFLWWYSMFCLKSDGMKAFEMNALCLAAMKGHKQMVQEFLTVDPHCVDRQDGLKNTAIIYASKYEHLEIVKLLLDNGADVNVQGNRGDALQTASSVGSTAIVEVLLAHGAHVNGLAVTMSALAHASAKCHIAVVELLLSEGADDLNGAVREAARGGCVEITELLLDKGATDYNNALLEASREGHTSVAELLLDRGANCYDHALHAAAEYGHLAIVEMLLQKGVNIDVPGRDGTALIIAVRREDEAMFEFLLNKGANLNCRGLNGDTALGTAVRWRRKAMVNLLLGKGADVNASETIATDTVVTPLYYASQMRSYDIVELLLTAGANTNDPGSARELLVAAAREGHMAVVELLLDIGADVNGQNLAGFTALLAAAWSGQVAVVELLSSRGANVNHADSHGRTAIHAAMQGGHMAVFEVLLKNGAVQPPDGLVSASASGSVAMVELLLQQGADVDAVKRYESHSGPSEKHVTTLNAVKRYRLVPGFSDKHKTALNAAAYAGHAAVIEILLSYGAQLSALPLVLASYRGHLAVVELLVSNGLDINESATMDEDRNPCTPLEASLQGGFQEVADFLVSKEAKGSVKALVHASVSGYMHVIEVLINQGVDINAVSSISEDSEVQTALEAAVQFERLPVADYLISKGANCTERTLVRASSNGYIKIVELSLKQGIDINTAQMSKWGAYVTALEAALEHEKQAIADFLISKGAKCSVATLVSASRAGHMGIVELSLRQGIDVNIPQTSERDVIGMTALEAALEQDEMAIVDFLVSEGAEEREGTEFFSSTWKVT